MNPEPLLLLFASQSESDAEATIFRALEDIAGRLDRVQSLRAAGAYDQIEEPALRIAAVAGGIGLTDVRKVAQDVGTAAVGGCGIALGATMARLERCFDLAVSGVWDYRLHS